MELGHAGAGEAWMPRYLGRTWADIASMLWEKDWNAIPELYDDSFGKHILIYPPACIVTAWTSALEPSPSSPRRRRASLPSGVSSNPSPSSSLSITDVRASTDCVGKSGAWNGFPVEVYRLHPRGYFALVQLTCASIALSRLFKYDEPHMIHPDCGEVTQFGTRSKGRTMRRRMGLAWRRPRYAGILRLKELRTRLKNAAGGSDEAKPRGSTRMRSCRSFERRERMVAGLPRHVGLAARPQEHRLDDLDRHYHLQRANGYNRLYLRAYGFLTVLGVGHPLLAYL
ncbi:hypothetical protein C8R46DRAFT_1042490 [Mycena filopes]|nr:hypothetical protein C8R46DRAFT_1042490 [Mycena filopes]